MVKAERRTAKRANFMKNIFLGGKLSIVDIQAEMRWENAKLSDF
jgi:hypothetical protein